MSSRRVTREQVDDVLQKIATYEGWEQSLLAAICRDWLDMDAREAEQSRLGVPGVQELIDTRNRLAAAQRQIAKLEAVGAAARGVDAALDNDEFDTTNIVVETVLLRLANALAALDAEGRGGEGT